jgi:hypothetical protein
MAKRESLHPTPAGAPEANWGSGLAAALVIAMAMVGVAASGPARNVAAQTAGGQVWLPLVVKSNYRPRARPTPTPTDPPFTTRIFLPYLARSDGKPAGIEVEVLGDFTASAVIGDHLIVSDGHYLEAYAVRSGGGLRRVARGRRHRDQIDALRNLDDILLARSGGRWWVVGLQGQGAPQLESLVGRFLRQPGVMGTLGEEWAWMGERLIVQKLDWRLEFLELADPWRPELVASAALSIRLGRDIGGWVVSDSKYYDLSYRTFQGFLEPRLQFDIQIEGLDLTRPEAPVRLRTERMPDGQFDKLAMHEGLILTASSNGTNQVLDPGPCCPQQDDEPVFVGIVPELEQRMATLSHEGSLYAAGILRDHRIYLRSLRRTDEPGMPLRLDSERMLAPGCAPPSGRWQVRRILALDGRFILVIELYLSRTQTRSCLVDAGPID